LLFAELLKLNRLVYIPTTSTSSRIFAREQNYTWQAGRPNRGIVQGAAVQALAAGPTPPMIGPPPPAGERGILVAWDPVMQKERWHTSGGGGTNGGTVTTAGNLVFQVIPDGRLIAYSADKGEKLWEVQTGLKSGMGPPITYQLDGRQYVALMGGTGVVVPVNPPPAGTPATPAVVPVLPELLTFVLDGKASLPSSH
jgi:quinohemoprotein ethanol dehydrogenase